MNTTDYSNGYLFTREQAAKVARDLIVSHHETVSLANQDADRLAYRISGILGIAPNCDAVENALNLLDELLQVERGTHTALDINRAGTIDNTPEVMEHLEIQLSMAIDQVAAGFRDHWELAS
jgi:hypothetical protein